MKMSPTSLNPELSVELRGQLEAAVVAGDQDAAALARITAGRPISPAEQALATEGLKRMEPMLYGYALKLARPHLRLAQLNVGPVCACAGMLAVALRPLMLNANDLTWASHTLAATLAAATCALARELVSPQALEDAWRLAPDLLAHAAQNCPSADLQRAWHEIAPPPWEAAATAWLRSRDAADRQALIATRHHLELETPGHALHWLACEAARRGLPIPVGSPVPPVPLPVLPHLPAHPGPLLEQLHALAKMGDPGAIALASLCGGEAIAPRNHPLALRTLARLQPTIIQATSQSVAAEEDEDSLLALTFLVHDAADLTWVGRTLAAWQVPVDDSGFHIDALELMWDLADSALAYARERGLAGDLQRPWAEANYFRWTLLTPVWPPLSTRGVERALTYHGEHLALESWAESLHWLAGEALRRERHETCQAP